MGIARFDVVKHEDGRQMVVTARKVRGLFSLKPLDGSKTLTDVPRKRFSLLWHSNGEIVTLRPAFPTSGQACRWNLWAAAAALRDQRKRGGEGDRPGAFLPRGGCKPDSRHSAIVFVCDWRVCYLPFFAASSSTTSLPSPVCLATSGIGIPSASRLFAIMRAFLS